ncbi:hypothetical protein PQ465_15360 [Sphingobacterium oryzagri]|uniref:OmpA family protein n=1 Tax=Sphingobacterium oryzagri TaxID=3025669 RepID=A0ABY7WH21_9SPHI|nr:hypothetical protein [Sphingobacterium sp. KACC 22765]WDF67678.1 hypothetical protein PQ465_15360 [Sphingobacterium sp. KACC 22765]
MSKKAEHSVFWVSFSDLMTSLFFIVLVLFVVTYVNNRNTIVAQEKQLRVYNEVEESLKPLKQDSSLFNYDGRYKRFLLSFDVKFAVGRAGINIHDLHNFDATRTKILDAGKKLKSVLDTVVNDALSEGEQRGNRVTYLVVISGYASKLDNFDDSPQGLFSEYQLSYARAYSLWRFWTKNGINFENKKYKGLIDLQLAGNGWGGVGRSLNEQENQRFVVQVVPKISNTND